MAGIGGTAAGALSSIGSDLSISISFQVASELIEAGKEGQLRDDELVGVVISLAIGLTAVRQMLTVLREGRREAAKALAKECMEAKLSNLAVDEKQRRLLEQEEAAVIKFDSERTVLDFALLFVGIATRISFSVTVQLLAAAARSQQSVRAARVLTLVSLSVFFVYLEAGGDKRLF